MTKYLGSLITADESKALPSQNYETISANGVWNLNEQLMLNRQSKWPTVNVEDPAVLVENVFSIDLKSDNSYNSVATTVSNGIDLSANKGMVMVKSRSQQASTSSEGDFLVYNTVRGGGKATTLNSTAAEATRTMGPATFNSSGFVTGAGPSNSSTKMCYWTFREAPKFFDVVTYTGNGSSSNSYTQTINHNLGAVPGMIWVMPLSTSGNYPVYHRGIDATYPERYYSNLNSNGERVAITEPSGNSGGYPWNWFAPTATQFQVKSPLGGGDVNQDGIQYVAYLFGHDTSSVGMINCGSYTADSGSELFVDLSFEPQLVMIKNTSEISGTSGEWFWVDTARGINNYSGVIQDLHFDGSAESQSGGSFITMQELNSGGFGFLVSGASNGEINTNGCRYIYMAIRKPTMKSLNQDTISGYFSIASSGGAATPPPRYYSNFPVDMALIRKVNNTSNWDLATRSITTDTLRPNDATAIDVGHSAMTFDYGKGINSQSTTDSNQYAWMWRIAKGYFDIKHYRGTGSNRTILHSLGVTPEMIWVKSMTSAHAWYVYFGDNTDYLKLNTAHQAFDDNTIWNDTSPTSTTFSIGTEGEVNTNGEQYIALLFATVTKISKIGTFSHTNGSTTDVPCNFLGQSQFVMVKRTDSSGSWYIWDRTRGIVAGNDPYVLLDSNLPSVDNTDYIDPLTGGFQMSATFATGSYFFYALSD